MREEGVGGKDGGRRDEGGRKGGIRRGKGVNLEEVSNRCSQQTKNHSTSIVLRLKTQAI